jgi:hypothetical protein
MHAEPKLLEIIEPVGLVFAGLWAAFRYHEKVKLQRAEWLEKLHLRFFGEPTYKRTRRILDYDSSDEFQRLRQHLQSSEYHSDVEDFVDYLNFFEFIAHLWKMEQLDDVEVRALFDYYLRLLRQHDFVVRFIRDQGFEALYTMLLDPRFQ